MAIARSNAAFVYPVAGGLGLDLAHLPVIAFDVETTGLNSSTDRVVEVAIVRVNSTGEVLDEWASMLDPGRDVGPTFIHHITNEMVQGAPTFRDLVGEILPRLEGGVVASHYAVFEEGFLSAELARMELTLPPMPALCTLELSQDLFDSPNYRLESCCECMGVEQQDTGGALGDARCKAQLARQILLTPGLNLRWPTPAPTLPRHQCLRAPWTRVTDLRRGEPGWMANVLARLPMRTRIDEPAVASRYRDLLSRALADGRVTGDKARTLARMAGQAGLGAAELTALHRHFLDGLVDSALADHVLTANEFHELRRTATLLGLPGHVDDLEERVEQPAQRSPRVAAASPRVWCSPRIGAEDVARLESQGYVIARNITKSVRCAIVTPDDLNDPRIQRANGLGIRVRHASEVPELYPPTPGVENTFPPPAGHRHPPWLSLPRVRAQEPMRRLLGSASRTGA